ncbi:hypothetical protein [Microbacterium plantarum]|uniref:Uncharacterized protein n=1 Tax=Microbacterium plantarum TaxID=1816425 RepID=A0ABV5EUP7_9MICO
MLLAAPLGLSAFAFDSFSNPGAALALPERSGTTARISSVATVTAVAFSTDGLKRQEIDAPAEVRIEAASETQIVLRWDARVFEASETAFSYSPSGELRLLSAKKLESGTAVFVVPAGHTTLMPQLRQTVNYPLDLVDDAERCVIELAGVLTNMEIRVTPAQTWGAELLAGWALASGQYVPTFIEVRSVGPGPLPDGLAVEANVSSVSVPDVVAGSELLVQGTSVAGTRTMLSAPVPGGLLASESWKLDVAVDQSRNSVPTLDAVSWVNLVFAPELGVDSRRTGKYSSAPVTPSLTALSDFTELVTA